MRGGKLASSGLVLACTFSLKHNAHAEPAYRMVFSDEFDGTTLNTKDSPSDNINASNGATTVVFPAPMIICLTLETSTRTSGALSVRRRR